MNPILFLPRLRSPDYSQRQKETDDFLTVESSRLESAGWTVQPHVISPANRFAYAKGMSTVWGQGNPLLILEHDVIPAPGQLQELANCPHHVCTIPYPLHMCRHRAIADRTTKIISSFVCVDHAIPVPSYRVLHTPAAGGFAFGPEHADYADLTSLGATKFSNFAQRLTWPVPRVTWSLLDDAISRFLYSCRPKAPSNDLRIHLHWPAARHNHPMPITPHEPVYLNGGQHAPCTHISQLPPDFQAAIRSEMAREPPPPPLQIPPPD